MGERDPLPVVISYSGGTSSEWLVRAVLEGALPRPRHVMVLFADTGAEHSWTYDAVVRVERDCAANGLPFRRCAAPVSLPTHLLGARSAKRLDNPPVFIRKENGGQGRLTNTCTRQWKIRPMRRATSEWLKEIGMPKRVEKWIGFARDEAHRAQRALGKLDVQWERMAFPGLHLSRAEQRAQVEQWAGSAPPFSMCTCCPNKTLDRWEAIPEHQREQVYEIDEAIRDASSWSPLDGDAYLSSRLVPVRALLSGGVTKRQLEMFDDVENTCDGGHCFL